MQLTDQQLDAAARKLCELRNGDWNDNWDRKECELITRDAIAGFPLVITAIIHAVTKGTEDEDEAK